MTHYIILDRDGVINQDSDNYIRSPNEWNAIPGSLKAIAKLTQNNYRVIVASNQPGITRQKFTIDDLNAIHRKMMTHLDQFGATIEAIFFCPHDPNHGCNCRKPKPGMLIDIIERLHITPAEIFFVGDSSHDIKAAKAAQVKPVLVRTGNGARWDDSGHAPIDVPVYNDLGEFVDELLSRAAT